MWDSIAAAVSARTGVEKETVFQRSVEQRSAMKTPQVSIYYGCVSDKPMLKLKQSPQDIANVVSFLVSNKADRITGQSVIVDGGIVFS